MLITRMLQRSLCLLLIAVMITAMLPPTALAAGKTGFEMISGKLYYYENGVRKTGWVPAYEPCPNMQGYERMYLYKDGTWAMGWFYDGGYWYYLHGGGHTHIGMLQFNANTVYEMDLKGRMVTGWYKYQDLADAPWYYFNKNGIRHNGWLKDPADNKWYYLNSYYGMQTGWLQIKGIWYYFDYSGAMKTGWLKYNNEWYYMGSSGAMKTGWQRHNCKWYYMDSDGAMKTGWLKDNGKWYYLDGSGSMLTGKHTIGGKKYSFDKNGKLL